MGLVESSTIFTESSANSSHVQSIYIRDADYELQVLWINDTHIGLLVIRYYLQW